MNRKLKSKLVSGIALSLLLASLLTLASDVGVLNPVMADSIDLTDVILEASDNRNARYLFCADVDGDGDIEIVSGTGAGLRIWHCDGSTLTLEAENSTSVQFVFCWDVDSDGDMEIVTGGEALRVWCWDGFTLTLEAEEDLPGDVRTGLICCADVDGDGDIEIVTGQSLRVWCWDGFTLTLEVEGGIGAGPVCCADVDGDGDIEIVSATGRLLRIHHVSGPTLTLETERELSGLKWFSVISAIFAADVDEDGDIEILTGGYHMIEIGTFPYQRDVYSCELRVWRWDGATLAGEASAQWGEIEWTEDSWIRSIHCGDVDGDGQVEIVAGGQMLGQGHFSSWSKKGSVLVTENHEPTALGSPPGSIVRAVFCCDVDGDGQTEMVIGTWTGLGVWSVYLPPLFPLSLEVSQELPVEFWDIWDIEWFTSVFCYDVDGDGQTEILTAGYTFIYGRYYGVVRIWNWSGTTLIPEAYHILGQAPIGDTKIHSVFATDVDGDGDVEVVAAGDRLEILRWDGNVLAVEYSGGDNSDSVFCSDVDADGDVEIVLVGDEGLSILRWDGVSRTVETFDWLMRADAVFCEDVDGDGDVEMVCVRTDPFQSGTEAVLFVGRWDGAELAFEEDYLWGDEYEGTEVHSVVANDVDGDGDIEIVTVGRMRDSVLDSIREKGQLRVWRWDGATLTLEKSREWGTPAAPLDTEIYTVFCGDVDSDGEMEVITGGRADEMGQLRVWCCHGAVITPEAEKKWTMGYLEPYLNTGVKSVFCCDVDGDGEVELITGGIWEKYVETGPGGLVLKQGELRIWSFAHAYLTVRGLDDRIYYRVHSSSSDSWGDWHVIPSGATCDSPAAAVYSGRLYMVVRGMDGFSLWFGWMNLPDNSFNGWTMLSGLTESAPTIVSYGSQLVLVVRGLDNDICYRSYNCTSESWEDWHRIPNGATYDTPASSMVGDELHLVVRGMDGYSLWHGCLEMTTSEFSGWQLVGGATESKPSLTSSAERKELYLAVRGLDNSICYNIWNVFGWEGWTLLPGLTCDSPGATVIESSLHTIVRGWDEYSLWHGHVDLMTGDFIGWTLLDGSTSSAPTLTK